MLPALRVPSLLVAMSAVDDPELTNAERAAELRRFTICFGPWPLRVVEDNELDRSGLDPQRRYENLT
jgi:hypothetical protein